MRVLAGAVASGLLTFAVMVPKTEDYFECTKWVRGAPEDGPECVGDVIQLVPDPIPHLMVGSSEYALLTMVGLLGIWLALSVDGKES